MQRNTANVTLTNPTADFGQIISEEPARTDGRTDGEEEEEEHELGILGLRFSHHYQKKIFCDFPEANL